MSELLVDACYDTLVDMISVLSPPHNVDNTAQDPEVWLALPKPTEYLQPGPSSHAWQQPSAVKTAGACQHHAVSAYIGGTQTAQQAESVSHRCTACYSSTARCGLGRCSLRACCRNHFDQPLGQTAHTESTWCSIHFEADSRQCSSHAQIDSTKASYTVLWAVFHFASSSMTVQT